MDAMTQPLGLELPTEGRVWWGWHDGTEDVPECQIGPDLPFLSLAVALERRAEYLRLARELWGADADAAWDPTWLPVTDPSRASIALDCSVPSGAPSPIRVIEFEAAPSVNAVPRAESLGEVVALWVEAYDRGVWGFDAEKGLWEYRPERLSSAERQGGFY